MDRRQDGPTPVILVRFSGNPPAAPRRRKAVRSTAVRTEAPHLTLLQGEGIRAPQKLVPGPFIAPVRTGEHPEWGALLPGGLVDLPDPETPASHLEAAIDLLRRAAQAGSVSERGDATLVAIEHASRSFAELFDRDVAKKLLRDIADSL
jgi:hypothetical protein